MGKKIIDDEITVEEMTARIADAESKVGVKRVPILVGDRSMHCYQCAYSKEYKSLEGLRCLIWCDETGLPAQVDYRGYCDRGRRWYPYPKDETLALQRREC